MRKADTRANFLPRDGLYTHPHHHSLQDKHRILGLAKDVVHQNHEVFGTTMLGIIKI